ncbi:hypothetical protein Vi05172_g7732 [Venturia inaequalis]|nr:hypothetical protein Vi05172_g7732 [Venturia inaequalis]
MWLLNTTTLTLVHFMDDRQLKGRYAILSHTWGVEEVSFDEMHLESAKAKVGYQKILKTCHQAVKDKLKYAWVDTCCIDKSSSSELSEAINSMYRYYQNARVCYAYLSDLLPADNTSSIEERLRPCRWFSRGWTLQELIAPPSLIIYDSEWNAVASRSEIAVALAGITHIDKHIFVNRMVLWDTSVATRMSWASMRITTREEDLAYSLMGIFDINMPLLYGEGSKAFRRLQEEIIRTWTDVDHTILVWGGRMSIPRWKSQPLLASSPAQFPVFWPPLATENDGLVDRQENRKRPILSGLPNGNESFELSGRGLRITLPAQAANHDRTMETGYSLFKRKKPVRLDLEAVENKRVLVVLNCADHSFHPYVIGMYLRRRRSWSLKFISSHINPIHYREYSLWDIESLTTVPLSELRGFTKLTLNIAREPDPYV